MRTFFLFIFILVIFSVNKIYSQSTPRNTKFSLKGEIIGRDTGSLVLWHYANDNKVVVDTVKLNKGKFHFSGTVNRVCEALLWTDLKNRDFDDPSVIRFLLEPNNIYISYKMNEAVNPVITGSRSETEKRNWDKVKMSLLNSKQQLYKRIRSLAKLFKANPNPSLQVQINQVQEKIDSINESIKLVDVQYIKMHPNSYLSAYLLSKHTRKLSVDSIEIYYNELANDVKKSNVAHTVLMYIYPVTDDNDFRKANPLINIEFDQRLTKINSVYDLSLRDTLGNIIGLSSFRGKYLVIDFWASWCKPCVENIPSLNQMIKYYKSDSIQFISISIDKDSNDWKHSIIKHNFSGLQLSDLTGFISLAAIYCKVLWVPKYVVVDQNGRIINYDAPQADGPELKTLLYNLLKQSFQNPTNRQ
jgi:thiol-disulfide isomerase/thioredoxin